MKHKIKIPVKTHKESKNPIKGTLNNQPKDQESDLRVCLNSSYHSDKDGRVFGVGHDGVRSPKVPTLVTHGDISYTIIVNILYQASSMQAQQMVSGRALKGAYNRVKEKRYRF